MRSTHIRVLRYASTVFAIFFFLILCSLTFIIFISFLNFPFFSSFFSFYCSLAFLFYFLYSISMFLYFFSSSTILSFRYDYGIVRVCVVLCSTVLLSHRWAFYQRTQLRILTFNSPLSVMLTCRLCDLLRWRRGL